MRFLVMALGKDLVTVVVPTFNEEKAVARALSAYSYSDVCIIHKYCFGSP